MARRRKAKPAHLGRKLPIKVAIIGGGCAGMAAAWHLSKRAGIYEVQVFEKSHRLGGKGASGRDAEGHIEEHGLHVWLGFYENAFRMMRECYDEVRANEWGPRHALPEGALAHGSFEEAFLPEPHLGVSIRGTQQPMEFWSGLFPPTEDTPGDPFDEDTNPFTLSNYLARCFMLLKTLMQSVVDTPGQPAPGGARPKGRSPLDEALESDFSFDPLRDPAAVFDALARRLRTGMLVTAAGMRQAFTFLEQWAQRMNEGTWAAESALNFIEAVAAQMRKQLGDVVAVDPKLRWKTEVIDIVMAIAMGLYRDRVLLSEEGLDAINDQDYREWLRKHGAAQSTVDSQFIAGIYDLTFAYRDGDRAQPALAAGVALRGALRMFFTYRGAMFWRMRSGMGDAVFAPLYRVLAKRRVQFRFMHQLTGVTVELGEERQRRVSALEFASAPDGRDSPLDRAGCWAGNANAPEMGASGARLTVGNDFDAVIFALGIDDLRRVFDSAASVANGPIAAQSRALTEVVPDSWRDAFRYLATVGTKAAQVWMTRDLASLGWRRGPAIVTGLDAAFQTWADMSHTMPSENAWRERHQVARFKTQRAKSVAYFCGVVQEDPHPDKRTLGHERSAARLHSQLDALLAGAMKEVWPRAFTRSHTARASELHRYVQINLDGSDRYTLSLPGTIRYRLSPLDDWLGNASVAGDWTACGLDAGCVESAVMSGMLAAFAITNDEPPLESIIGYDHP